MFTHFPHRLHRLSHEFSGAGARPKPGTCQVRSEQPAGGQAADSFIEARSSVASGSLPPTHSYFTFHGYSITVMWVYTIGKLNHMCVRL